MGAARSALTEQDVRALMLGATEDARAEAAHKICRRIDGGLQAQERDAAHAILRILAADAAELVRRALAVTLKASPELPRDVALKLARDLDSIATPVLTFSPAFTDEDLAELLRSVSPAKQAAIAGRASLREPVTAVLAEVGAAEALATACRNEGARFTARALSVVLDRFPDSTEVTSAMALRASLPLAITERLITLVSAEVAARLRDRYELDPKLSGAVATGARERATVDLVEHAATAPDLKALVQHLKKQGRLTPSLILRALANGRMGFVEWALAELAGVPHHRAWIMIHDRGPLGLYGLYNRANLPQSLYPAFRAGVDAFQALQAEGGVDIRRLQQRLLERVLTGEKRLDPADADYLLARLDQVSDRRLAGAA